jgi:hypothetical protein
MLTINFKSLYFFCNSPVYSHWKSCKFCVNTAELYRLIALLIISGLIT